MILIVYILCRYIYILDTSVSQLFARRALHIETLGLILGGIKLENNYIKLVPVVCVWVTTHPGMNFALVLTILGIA